MQVKFHDATFEVKFDNEPKHENWFAFKESLKKNIPREDRDFDPDTMKWWFNADRSYDFQRIYLKYFGNSA